MTTAQKNRPTREDEAAIKAFGSAVTSLPDAADLLNGVFVILVAHRVDGELRYRRRVYMTLQAAQKAADRLTMSGQTCTVTLARLAPVHTFGGGWSE